MNPTGVASGQLQPGRYESDSGGYFEILDVQFPGNPSYDGGATGVTVRWGRERSFIVAADPDHFWSRFPFSLFRRVPVPAVSPSPSVRRIRT